jgi:mannose-1-phosphate guanylyltransferase
MKLSKPLKKNKQWFYCNLCIVPTKPRNGLQFIEQGSVLFFEKKTNQVTATDFIEKGNFFWNSGMFCFKASVLLENCKIYSEVYAKSK